MRHFLRLARAPGTLPGGAQTRPTVAQLVAFTGTAQPLTTADLRALIQPFGLGTEAPDFLIHGPKDHGVKGLLKLYGMESPGLISSLAIADYVHDLLAA